MKRKPRRLTSESFDTHDASSSRAIRISGVRRAQRCATDVGAKRSIRRLGGTVNWEGNLEVSRLGRGLK